MTQTDHKGIKQDQAGKNIARPKWKNHLLTMDSAKQNLHLTLQKHWWNTKSIEKWPGNDESDFI